jgi:hypothetical protein
MTAAYAVRGSLQAPPEPEGIGASSRAKRLAPAFTTSGNRPRLLAQFTRGILTLRLGCNTISFVATRKFITTTARLREIDIFRPGARDPWR